MKNELVGVVYITMIKHPRVHSSYDRVLPTSDFVLMSSYILMELGLERMDVHTDFLAHPSRRLIGELIVHVYPWSGVYRRRPSTFSNIFCSKTAWPIKAKFYVESSWVGGTKVCSRHLGHMTKMAVKPIYGKNPSKIFFSRTGGPISTKIGM